MKARHTYRIYPTDEQAHHLARTFGAARYVWNWALNVRSAGFKDGQSITYPMTDARLTALKKEPETAWLNEISSVPLQQSLRDLQSAFTNFFSKRSAYPRFKRKQGPQSVQYTKSAFRLDTESGTLRLAKLGVVKVKWSRGTPTDASSVRVLRDSAGRYFASFVVEVAQTVLPVTGETVGIDFGLNRLATLSTGERISNPKHENRYSKRMALLQRRLARKTSGSKRRKGAALALAKVHAKIADARTDAIHKMTTILVKRFDSIYIEDLNLRGMVKNHSLARSVSDASLGMIARMLEAKAERYGRQVVKIDRWFPSSKMCSSCGRINNAVVLGVSEWTCPGCGVIHDRDDNAATNIKAVGQTVSAHGGTVRPRTANAVQRKSLRSANRSSLAAE